MLYSGGNGKLGFDYFPVILHLNFIIYYHLNLFDLHIYRENCLLVDEKLSSATDKLTVLGWIAHELAHQWYFSYTLLLICY